MPDRDHTNTTDAMRADLVRQFIDESAGDLCESQAITDLMRDSVDLDGRPLLLPYQQAHYHNGEITIVTVH
ncbi:hypothetical protein [Noviherbaspirillum pedocola]|uniref:Uncharacterized protein n=1 Tax=Noviherbaspirillum pedocola TaxID=2801341 RepID=A0A934SZQ7_9BURK|nr:hypothetical protein [Noviherbaspirillum pedocola]MBK4738738.1 hypothetical protein [Noviherbaspirillum pedocola]